MKNSSQHPFTFRLLDTKPRILLELTNVTDEVVRSVEILTIFLKDEEMPDGLLTQSHIKFDEIESMFPQQASVPFHRTWINGKPATDERDQMERLRVIAGGLKPYVLDISWENREGKARFHRIPVGH